MILDHNRESLIHGDTIVDLSHTAFKIIRRPEAAGGRVVPWDSLIASVWDDPDHEPTDAQRCIHVTMHRVKRRMEAARVPYPVVSRWGLGLRLDVSVFRDAAGLVDA